MGEHDQQVVSFRKALGNYPTGVTVVTGMDQNNEPIGLTVNSFASVSLDPLLVLWSIDENVTTYDVFRKIDRFVINILAEDQKDLAVLFSTKEEERFNHCDWTMSKEGLPVLSNTLATLECKTFNTLEVGDHTTMFGEVMNVVATDKTPLLYHKRNIGPLPKEFHEE